MDGEVIERDAPLSRSRLWDFQRAWFELAGERAWSEELLPSYVTTNPTMAAAIAALIVAWVRDGNADPGEPVTIVELGAGTGRLGWHVARALAAAPHVVPRFTYVLTDVPARTLAWWRAHPQLASAPHLAFARLDVEAPDDEPLPAEIPAGPLIVIATYLFDSVRCDAFAARAGALVEKRVSLIAPHGCDLGGEHALGEVARAWADHPVPADRYGDRDLDAVLAGYAALGDAELTFPIAGLRCLRRLERHSRGRMLAIAADKGFVDPRAFVGRSEPDTTHHGSISMAVNLHAFLADADRRGARTFATAPERIRLATIAIAHGAPRTDELARAWDDSFGHSGPDDWYALKRTIDRRYADCTLDELLALLRASRGDDNVLRGCAGTLFERTCETPPSQLAGIRSALTMVQGAYLWAGEPADLPFLVGTGLHLAGDPAAARAAWAIALDLHARAPRACPRLAVGGLWLGDPDDPRVLAVEAEPMWVDLRARLMKRE